MTIVAGPCPLRRWKDACGTMFKVSKALRVAMPRVLHLGKAAGKPGEVYYPLHLKEIKKPVPADNEVLVRLKAAALNHRDLFVRHHQYPAISLDHPMLSDGYGVITELGRGVPNRSLLGENVLLTPMRGWISDPAGPEDPKKWSITGSTRLYNVGTAQDYVCVHQDEVVPAPKHLSAVEGAALPLVGLTAWRALSTKAAVQPGQNILITGIGGGVAITALQFSVAMGVNVFVTSGSQEKLDRARSLGAQGGAIYKAEKWEAGIRQQLPSSRPYIDAVIDGAGGDIVSKAVKLLKPGGVIVQYGMTISPKMNWTMPAVLLNAELKGTTMGSRQEFRDMVAFVDRKGIRPVISRTVQGLSNLRDIDLLFDEMKAGRQMGKLVIEIEGQSSPRI
ncbi:PKS-ER domain-containing protein [Fusarium keratoplasticum]|uniref:PKS-ER domain-containing protein n=1 Tax=Fusarium keratoplasticum TaxID=1328300 RepID=A0ACC0QDY6_9HYPO|nr:PKS-ER domain-containing protein [Fusarium keratoplasticum]KAI8648625.1 PKS-ER domain-containing protein [Fusarium keratoplasticum]